MNNVNDYPSLDELKGKYIRSSGVFNRGVDLVQKQMCTLTNRKGNCFRFTVEDRFDDFAVEVDASGNGVRHSCSCRAPVHCCPHSAAALLQLRRKFDDELEGQEAGCAGDRYTREEMIRRVLAERRERAEKEDFRFSMGETIYGFHRVTTKSGRDYDVTIRDFSSQNGYCTCPDFRTNKLGTCKHLIFAVRMVRKKTAKERKLRSQPYPFVEIFCDPLNDYRITCFYKGKIPPLIDQLLKKYFTHGDYILPEHYRRFLPFFRETEEHRKILIRPEVAETIDRYFEDEELKRLRTDTRPDFAGIRLHLFDYQKEGVIFSLFKKGSVIADEMGLGKTPQAIAAAVLKKEIFGFRRVLVICPASLKSQWKAEIAKFSHETAVIVSGDRGERHDLYRHSPAYFLITNYEAVLRDITIIRNHPPDMVILDEAQRIKNYSTKTSAATKAIPKRHALVITGTPIENRLIDLYSVMNFVDPRFLAPLWEFSMNHCYFDRQQKNKIKGYFNLQALKKHLGNVMIRREKKEVLTQLPPVQEMTVPVMLTEEQQEMHTGFARALMPLLQKKHKTIYDMQRIFQLLTSMRMVCDSTYLIDKETHFSPKLAELEDILSEKLNIKENRRKLIIFSEWKTMLHLIEKVMLNHDIGYVMLSGEIPVKNRARLIDRFNSDPDCLVFLSTEAGGTGLNLQAADTVINFELPWNPAKKNQRIGRIHRLGQKSPKLTVINLVATESIEERIAAGIELKESLFDAVLNEGDLTDEVDFSAKGRSTVIEQVEKLVSPLLAAASEGLDREKDGHVFQEDVQLSRFDAEINEIAGDEESLTAAAEKPSPGALIHEHPSADDLRESRQASGRKEEMEPAARVAPSAEEMENTLNQGLLFLGGILRMATGKQLLPSEKAIQIDRQTGEVVLRFQLPGFENGIKLLGDASRQG